MLVAHADCGHRERLRHPGRECDERQDDGRNRRPHLRDKAEHASENPERERERRPKEPGGGALHRARDRCDRDRSDRVAADRVRDPTLDAGHTAGRLWEEDAAERGGEVREVNEEEQRHEPERHECESSPKHLAAEHEDVAEFRRQLDSERLRSLLEFLAEAAAPVELLEEARFADAFDDLREILDEIADGTDERGDEESRERPADDDDKQEHERSRIPAPKAPAPLEPGGWGVEHEREEERDEDKEDRVASREECPREADRGEEAEDGARGDDNLDPPRVGTRTHRGASVWRRPDYAGTDDLSDSVAMRDSRSPCPLWLLVVVAALAAVPAARAETPVLPQAADLPWADPTHRSPTEVLLSSVASAIADREVRVYCNGATDWETLARRAEFDAELVQGYVAIPAVGTGAVAWPWPATEAQLAPAVCEPLWRYGMAAQKPTMCDATRSEQVEGTATVRYRTTVPVTTRVRVRTAGKWTSKLVVKRKPVWRERIETRVETRVVSAGRVPCHARTPDPAFTVAAPTGGQGAYGSIVFALQAVAHEAAGLRHLTVVSRNVVAGDAGRIDARVTTAFDPANPAS